MSIESLSWGIQELKEQAQEWKWESQNVWRDHTFRREAIQILFHLQDKIIDRQRKLSALLAKKARLEKYA